MGSKAKTAKPSKAARVDAALVALDRLVDALRSGFPEEAMDEADALKRAIADACDG